MSTTDHNPESPTRGRIVEYTDWTGEVCAAVVTAPYQEIKDLPADVLPVDSDHHASIVRLTVFRELDTQAGVLAPYGEGRGRWRWPIRTQPVFICQRQPIVAQTLEVKCEEKLG